MIFLLSYVVPQVVTAFVQARQTPMLTQVMLAASAFVRSWGMWVGSASLRWWWPGGWPLRKAGLRLRWDAMLLRVPMVGRFVLV